MLIIPPETPCIYGSSTSKRNNLYYVGEQRQWTSNRRFNVMPNMSTRTWLKEMVMIFPTTRNFCPSLLISVKLAEPKCRTQNIVTSVIIASDYSDKHLTSLDKWCVVKYLYVCCTVVSSIYSCNLSWNRIVNPIKFVLILTGCVLQTTDRHDD
jgi:hypothetical protein